MKTKAFLLIAIVCFVIGWAPGEANAATYIGTIIQINVDGTDGTIYIAMDEQSDANWTGGRWFVATGAHAKLLLATAMMAMTNNYVLGMDLDSTAEWSPINSFTAASQ